MAGRGRTTKVLVQAFDGAELVRRPDELIVEEPMAIQLDGHLVATTMRTPGHDFELAIGFCHTEGLLAGATVTGCRYCAEGPYAAAVGGPRASRAADTEFNVVTVETGGVAPVPQPRLGPSTSSCGLCGSQSLAELATRLEPLGPHARPDWRNLRQVARRVRANQQLFERTGAVHAAAAFEPAGDLVVVREDIGRHNAVDKVVGNLLLRGALPARSLGLFVSSRASYEMVQKAWAAGFGLVVAVSAPSALAVETARAAGMVLIGFARDDRFTVYTSPAHLRQ